MYFMLIHFEIISCCSFKLYPNESGLGNFSNFIFLAYKAKNAGIALAMASIFNEVGRKKKKIKSPNYFRLGIKPKFT